MKKTVLLLLTALVLSACNNTTNNAEKKTKTASDKTNPEYQYYGDSISDVNTIQANRLLTAMNGKDSMLVKVEGQINESCKVKGCWMKMDLGNNKEMHITFEDYSFFVPKNLNGETAVIEGYAKIDTLDVSYLKHLAEDAGKSEDEIAGITKPEVSLTYVAKGVIIKS